MHRYTHTHNYTWQSSVGNEPGTLYTYVYQVLICVDKFCLFAFIHKTFLLWSHQSRLATIDYLEYELALSERTISHE